MKQKIWQINFLKGLKKMIKEYFKKLKDRYWNEKTAKILTNVVFLGLLQFIACLDIKNVVKIIILLFLWVGFVILHEIFIEIEKQAAEIPILSKRFTKKMPDGSVGIKNGEIEQAILYLYEIEEKLNM